VKSPAREASVSAAASRARAVRLRAGTAVFVGEDHHLDPVPELQFGQDARDLGLDGGLGEVEALGDLGVLRPVAMTARGFCPRSTAG
jgi:hypothetical protein